MTAAAQCEAEIERRERAIRAGESLEMKGLLQGLQDWSAELRLIEAEPAVDPEYLDDCGDVDPEGSLAR